MAPPSSSSSSTTGGLIGRRSAAASLPDKSNGKNRNGSSSIISNNNNHNGFYFTSNGRPGWTSSKTSVPSYHSKRKPRRSQRRQRATMVRYMMRILLAILAVVALMDLYFVVSIKKQGKSLKDIRPMLREQVDKMERLILKRPAPEYSPEGVDQEYSGVYIPPPPPPPIPENLDELDVDADKTQIYEILRQAGIDWKTLSREDRYKLPTWTDLTTLYGDHPYIVGLDRCEDFTRQREMSTAFFGIAGTFNSGTNLLAELLIKNCQIEERMVAFGVQQKGMRWQVPWGKHSPVRWRWQHVTTTDKDVPVENSFPMITIRDPYFWLGSMCRHPYALKWPHNASTCPNIVRGGVEGGPLNKCFVKYKEDRVYHDSVLHMYNEWYQEYLAVDFPRILVRFEDILLFGQNVTETLCKCGGGKPRRKQFHHVENSAKMGTAAHGSQKTGLVQALQRYGNFQHRLDGFTAADIAAAKKHFDPRLLQMFNYHHPTETVGRLRLPRVAGG